jgi:multisubunit Na+/H+ antiporter MnhB subunit
VTPHQIVAVALRLFAVWLGLQALTTVPSFFTLNGFHSPNYGWVTFMLAITAVVIFALWVFPLTIAGKLIPRPERQAQPSATPDVWLAIGCTLLGLWTLTTAIPRLVYDYVAWNAMSSYDDRSQLQHWVVYHLVELAIAVWLILGAKGVRKVFWWAQNVAIRKDL